MLCQACISIVRYRPKSTDDETPFVLPDDLPELEYTATLIPFDTNSHDEERQDQLQDTEHR